MIQTIPFITVTATIPVGFGPWKVGVDDATGRVFVMNDGESTVSVIDSTSQRVVRTIAVEGGVSGLAYDSAADILYLSNWKSNTISRLDGLSLALIDRLPAGGFPLDLAWNATSRTLYASSSRSSTLNVYPVDALLGSAPGVRFTSGGEVSPGQWRGIAFEPRSRGMLRDATIQYGGGDGYGISIAGDAVLMLNSVVQFNHGDGILVRNASPQIGGTTIQHNSGNGILIQGPGDAVIWGNAI